MALESQAALLSVQRTADILGVSRATVLDMVEVGQLQAVRPGRSQRPRVIRDSVARFLASGEAPAEEQKVSAMPREFLG